MEQITLIDEEIGKVLSCVHSVCCVRHRDVIAGPFVNIFFRVKLSAPYRVLDCLHARDELQAFVVFVGAQNLVEIWQSRRVELLFRQTPVVEVGRGIFIAQSTCDFCRHVTIELTRKRIWRNVRKIS